MEDPNFSWIYLIIFLAIPLARIIPRILPKRRQSVDEYTRPEPFQESQNTQWNTKQESVKPKTKDMQVLGIMHQGANTFDKIQRAIKMDSKELDSILQDLEKHDLIKVIQKQGMFGPKVELYSTDKGFKEYYS
jgi:predicted HTH transcriptional regulator